MHDETRLDFSDLKEVLDRITSRLVESSEPGALFEAVVEIAMHTTQAQASSLYLEQQEQGDRDASPTIVMVAGAGYELHRVGKAFYQRGQGLTGWIWEQSRSVKYDTAEELESPGGPWRGVHNTIIREKVPGWVCSSLIGVPLRIGARTIGVIKVENKNPAPPARFSARDLLVLELIASTIAVAIENRRLSEKTYTDILVALREVSDILVSKDIMPFSALCDRIVRKCIEMFNAQASSLYLGTPGSDLSDPLQTITMVAGAGYEIHRIRKAEYRKGQGLTGWMWEQGRSVKYDTTAEVEDARGPWRGVHNSIIREKVPGWICSSLIGVPLRIGTRNIGVIKVENKNPAPHAHFSHEELRSLEILASNIALALEMLNRHREIFWQGERARTFAHNLANQVRNALLHVHESRNELRQLPAPDHLSNVQERLTIVEKTLSDLEQLRRQTLTDAPARRHRAPADVKTLAQDVLSRSDKILDQNHVELTTSFPPEPLFANVDRDQILQALGNILSNAIEALANQPHPTIRLTVEHRPSTNEATIAIVDNGPGLTNEQRDKFRQAGSIPSTKHFGVGAGLPEASRCCGDNGGYIEVLESPPHGSGGAFRIVLPTCEPQLLRIAIIDDDERVLESFQLALKARNDIHASYFTSPDCLTGVSDTANLPTPDVEDLDFVLLDCRFERTGQDGIQLYRELSKTATPLASKILLMSGHEEPLRVPGLKVYDKFTEILGGFEEFIASLHSRRSLQ